MLAMLVPPSRARVLGVLRSALGDRAAEKLCRRYLRALPSSPGVFLPSDFRRTRTTAYNSVGGWPLAHAGEAELAILSQGLQSAAFVSVRDRRTQELLCARCGVDAAYAPDIAFLLSSLFPASDLRSAASPRLVRQLEEDGYWCLQVNPALGRRFAAEIAHAADAVGGQAGLRTLLTPIGRHTDWNDRAALHDIREAMREDAMTLSAETTIFDIAFAISGSACLVGTSLHGIVTAAAYGIPFVAIQSDDPKVSNNLSSWGADELFPPVRPDDLTAAVLDRLESRPEVASLAAKLQDQAARNLTSLAKAVSATERCCG